MTDHPSRLENQRTVYSGRPTNDYALPAPASCAPLLGLEAFLRPTDDREAHLRESPNLPADQTDRLVPLFPLHEALLGRGDGLYIRRRRALQWTGS